LMATAALLALAGGCPAPRATHPQPSGMPTAIGPPSAQSTATSSATAVGGMRSAHETEPGASEPKVLTDRHGNPIPEQYSCSLEVLEWLAKNFAALASPDLDPSLRPHWAEISAHFAPQGVRFVDDDFASSGAAGGAHRSEPTGKLKAELQPSQIEQQLRDRRGIAFFRLTNLGRSYSLAHPNHSKLGFRPTSGGVIVEVGLKKYELTFALQGECRLQEVHYLIVEAE
jgi:hypothetical protein